MSGPPEQRTRVQALSRRLGRSLIGPLGGSWRSASLAFLALLLGFFLAENLSSLLLVRFPGGRPLLVLALVLAIEILIRLRSRLVSGEPPFPWVLIDNLRIGIVYALVLEAIKLGT